MTILAQLFEITLLKRRPQDIDYHPSAAVLALVAVIGFQYWLTASSGQFTQPLQISAVQYICQAAVLFLFLSMAQKAGRFVQVSTALFGVSAILSAVLVLADLIPGLALFTVFVMAWSFYITVLVFKDAFDANIFIAILITIGLSVTAVIISFTILPEFKAEFMQSLQNAQQTAASAK